MMASVTSIFNHIIASPLTALILFAIIIATVLYLWFFNREPAGLPPGPKGVPIIGNIAQLSLTNPCETLTKWAQQYGPIYRIYMANTLTIVISDYELVKEAFSGKTGDSLAGQQLHNPYP